MRTRTGGFVLLAILALYITTVSGQIIAVDQTPLPVVAVAPVSAPSPAAPQSPAEQVEWALAASLGLRYVTKKRWLGFLTPESQARTKAAVGGLLALLTAAGVHLVVNGSFFTSATVTISGLSFDMLKDVVFQWVAQQGWYEAIVKQGYGPQGPIR